MAAVVVGASSFLIFRTKPYSQFSGLMADALWLLVCAGVVYGTMFAPATKLLLSAEGLEVVRGSNAQKRRWTEITGLVLSPKRHGLGVEAEGQQTLWLLIPGHGWSQLADSIAGAYAAWSGGAKLPRPELENPSLRPMLARAAAAGLLLASAWAGWPVWSRPAFDPKHFDDPWTPYPASVQLRPGWPLPLLAELALLAIAFALFFGRGPSRNERVTLLSSTVAWSAWAAQVLAIMTAVANLVAVWWQYAGR
jgi:hypothetical protein